MADNIKLVTYSGSTVTPLDDALVYEKAVGQSGIIYGAEITLKNTNTLHINAGHGVVCGRKFTIVDSDIPVQLTAGTTNLGRVYIHLDLSNTTEPIQIMTEVAATLTAPIQQEDVNINNGVYEFNMATFTIDAQTISDVVNVFIPIENTTGNLNDLTTEDKSSLVAAVNEINKKEVSVLDTGEEIMANTASNKAAGAKGVKELFTEVTDSLTADNAQAFQFAYDSASGKYGYKVKEADTDVFVPFNSNWRIEDIYAHRASNGYCWLHYVVNTVGINTLKWTMTSAGTSSALAMYDDKNNLLINDDHKLTEKTYTHDVSSYSKVIIVAINSGADQAVRLVNFEYIA